MFYTDLDPDDPMEAKWLEAEKSTIWKGQQQQ